MREDHAHPSRRSEQMRDLRASGFCGSMLCIPTVASATMRYIVSDVGHRRYGMLRILIVEPFEDLRAVLVEAFRHAREDVETHSIGTLATLRDVVVWEPTVAVVAAELLIDEVSVGTLRESLPSLRYVVGMVNTPYDRSVGCGCDRIVVRPFAVAALLEDLMQHAVPSTN